jgi:hypothetical protein
VSVVQILQRGLTLSAGHQASLRPRPAVVCRHIAVATFCPAPIFTDEDDGGTVSVHSARFR